MLVQAPEWFPMAQTLSAQYTKHLVLADTAFDTLLATLAALLIFLGLPAMDLVLGQDPKNPAQVHLHCTPPTQDRKCFTSYADMLRQAKLCLPSRDPTSAAEAGWYCFLVSCVVQWKLGS